MMTEGYPGLGHAACECRLVFALVLQRALPKTELLCTLKISGCAVRKHVACMVLYKGHFALQFFVQVCVNVFFRINCEFCCVI